MKKQINTSQSNKSFSTKGSRIFVVLVFALILLIIPNNNSYSMSFFNKEKSPQGTINNPYQLPVSVPIDITRKGNKLEFYVEVKENSGYSFELEYRYNDPRYNKNSKYYEGFFRRNFKEISTFQKYFKEYSKEELNEILEDYDRVRRLIDYEELIKFGTGESYKSQWIKHQGIPTPIHLTIFKIAKNENQKVILDKINEYPKLISWGGTFNKTIDNGMHFDVGIYKISAESLKDSPELIGTKIYFFINSGTSWKFTKIKSK